MTQLGTVTVTKKVIACKENKMLDHSSQPGCKKI